MSTNINITYDLLFDILRYEKSRDELQPLDKDFFKNVVEYLQAKDALLLSAQTPVTERELTRIQVNNVKKLLTELYERRERKIINLALYKIKTGSDTINIASLLEDEKILFDSLLFILGKYKQEILDNILNNKIPFTKALDFPDLNIAPASVNKPVLADDKMIDDDSIKSVRFIRPVPKFLGPELETYGPFEEQDIASLPSRIANILIRKVRAEEIKSE